MVVATGSGGRLDPTQVAVSDLGLTEVDPLARELRRILREKYGFPEVGAAYGIPAVYSAETPTEPMDLTYDGGKGYKPVGAVHNHLIVEGGRCQGNTNCVPICPVQARSHAGKTVARLYCRGPAFGRSDFSSVALLYHRGRPGTYGGSSNCLPSPIAPVR